MLLDAHVDEANWGIQHQPYKYCNCLLGCKNFSRVLYPNNKNHHTNIIVSLSYCLWY